MRLSMLAALAAMVTTAHAADIRIATFNTESDADTEPMIVAETIRQVPDVDIWAIQELESEEALRVYAEAAKVSGHGRWRYIISESGTNNDPEREPDFVGLLYRTDLFRQLETIELHTIRSTPIDADHPLGRVNWALRGALFLRLLHTDSNTEIYVGTVHLKCCGDGIETREHQAKLLSTWIKSRDVPVILLGDTNIPIEPGQTGTDEAAFVTLTTDAGLTWIAPTNPIKTQCSPDFNSMLDQVYTSASFPAADGGTEIMFPEEEYCEAESEGGSDHRPMVGTFVFP